MGGRVHGRPARRPRARDRLRSRCRRRADLQRLETGKLFAIDRSESGVDRTRRRSKRYVDAGRLTVRQIDLATLRVPVKRLHKVFAFNVNLFWVRECGDEVALLHERVLPGGAVHLFFEASRPEQVPEIVTKASAALAEGGFRVSVVDNRTRRGRDHRAPLKAILLNQSRIRLFSNVGSLQVRPCRHEGGDAHAGSRPHRGPARVHQRAATDRVPGTLAGLADLGDVGDVELLRGFERTAGDEFQGVLDDPRALGPGARAPCSVTTPGTSAWASVRSTNPCPRARGQAAARPTFTPATP